eukprot:TRINITY_DN39_c0_g1_i3.p1 TRINITY_DN39_c0_g1~~TRINITY_DN39_c0_g1_i3.p1  ORF type:complete len:309 (+),score=42.25 TRINITY_DN39_c0_g1_i3:624-1550(+)
MKRPNPSLTIPAHGGAIYCLQFTVDGNTLVTGGDSETRIWSWTSILGALHDKQSGGSVHHLRELQAPRPVLDRGALGPLSETNDLCISSEHSAETLYTAVGDHNTYAWDMETGQITGTFTGHRSYLHAVRNGAAHEILTGSEDGTVRIWDIRNQGCTRVLTPAEDAKRLTQRSNTNKKKRRAQGNWIGALAVDRDANWMACGGGAHTLYLYHLASGMVASTMECQGALQTAMFNQPDDTILCAGIAPIVYHWKKDGSVEQQSDVSCKSVFSVSINEHGNNRVLAASGTSSDVDIFINFANRAFSFGVQ